MEAGQQLRQIDEGRQAVGGADRQPTARQALHLGHRVAGALRRRQHPPRLLGQHPAGGGQVHPPR
ncbi:hypothetical protein, partial [Inquilinus limosus]|uniref:hypothetical protein n=1 Tax=Inquilinus limosus TaxID=171674 RepID=UPI001EE736B1